MTIYKLVCRDTVDEHMLEMAERKAKLNDDVLEEVCVLLSFKGFIFLT